MAEPCPSVIPPSTACTGLSASGDLVLAQILCVVGSSWVGGGAGGLVPRIILLEIARSEGGDSVTGRRHSYLEWRRRASRGASAFINHRRIAGSENRRVVRVTSFCLPAHSPFRARRSGSGIVTSPGVGETVWVLQAGKSGAVDTNRPIDFALLDTDDTDAPRS